MAGPTLFVTGTASGIGLATAQYPASAQRLILVDRDAEALARIALPCTVDLLSNDAAL